MIATKRRLLLLPFVYACWLGMMAVHEAGHVLHARVSGGVVERVSIPLVGFSLTSDAVNPRPGFVAWGGAVWGCVIPLVLLAVLVRAPRAIRSGAQFFAGFCLIANGVYVGVGWTTGAGDAGELRQHGTPVWSLVVFGIVATALGLFLWHLLGVRRLPRAALVERVSAPASERAREDPDQSRLDTR